MTRFRWLACALLACGTAPAQQILFTTLGPGESFPGIPSLSIGAGEFWNLSGNNGAILAAAFTPSVTVPFSHADFALSYNYVAYKDLTGPPDLDVTLAEDAGGAPGDTIETIHITNAFGGSTYSAILTASSALHPVLQQGVQYWLVLAPPDLLHTAFTWMLGPVGAQNSLPTGQFLAQVTSFPSGWGPASFPQGNSPGMAVYGGGTSNVLPAIPANGVVSAASYTAPVSSASWVSLFGTNLSTSARGWQASDFTGAALPVSLDGVSVLVNGVASAVSYISPGQVNLEVPDLDPSAGVFSLQIVTQQGASVPVALPYALYSPALFAFEQDGAAYPLATRADGTVVTAASPIRPGETLVLYGSGFGPSSPAIASGTLVSAPEPLAESANLTITIGGLSAQILYAGITEAGVDQINVTVPQVAAGNQALVVTLDGSAAQPGLLLPVAAP